MVWTSEKKSRLKGTKFGSGDFDKAEVDVALAGPAHPGVVSSGDRVLRGAQSLRRQSCAMQLERVPDMVRRRAGPKTLPPDSAWRLPASRVCTEEHQQRGGSWS